MTGEATVVKNAGSHYMLSMLPEWNPFPAVLKGRIRLKANDSTNPVAVGDKVRFEADAESADGVTLTNPALITEILDRKNYVVRKSTNLSRQSHVIAANIDMAFAVVTLYFPEVKLPFLDRMLVTCEVYGVPVTIVMNKVDLYREEAPEFTQNFIDIYTKAGYKVVQTSAKTGEGIDELREICRDKVCLFSGESGVGKCSLIKAVGPSVDPQVG
uniref:ribosome small subunit-dependent GTPase A n=1 Tax=Candidatus Cryptobacteroides bacterium TaxID=3085639 RepID=UPI0040276C20